MHSVDVGNIYRSVFIQVLKALVESKELSNDKDIILLVINLISYKGILNLPTPFLYCKRELCQATVRVYDNHANGPRGIFAG